MTHPPSPQVVARLQRIPPPLRDLALLRQSADKLRQLSGELDSLVALLGSEDSDACPDNPGALILEYGARIEAGAHNVIRIATALGAKPEAA